MFAAYTLIGGLIFAGGYYYGSGSPKQESEEILTPSTTSCTTSLESLSSPQYGSLEDRNKAIEEIQQLLGLDHVSFSQQVKSDHSDTYWNSHHAEPGQIPFAVVFPSSTEEVLEIMKICTKYRIPVVPFLGGTSLEGHFIPTRHGICIDMNRMNQILALHEKDLDVVVQPAVPWEDLGEYLDDKGLMFGCDPGPTAQIGGMVATSCSGTNAARYGTMKDNVLSLTVVLADGTIVKTRKRPRKSLAGYNLTNLFVGSEGTLGIVTEATLKLYVKPAYESVAVVSYPDISDAASTVQDIVAKGIQVNAVELLDDEMMKCINHLAQTTRQWSEKPTLFFKLGGASKKAVDELIKTVENVSYKNNRLSFEFASSEEEKLELWHARKIALWSTIDYGKFLDKDIQIWTTDVAVPVSRLSKVLKETKDEMKASGLLATLVGHVGDGNFHAFLLYKPLERARAEELVNSMVHRALENDGTCTGEHGVGYGKRDFLELEVGPQTVDLMRRVKMALDPLRLLNTDKIFRVDPEDRSH